jgi:hypothetical protein
MRIVVLHASDATEPPVDPVLGQVREALGAAGHDASLLAVDRNLGHTVQGLTERKPDLVFNLAESPDCSTFSICAIPARARPG